MPGPLFNRIQTLLQTEIEETALLQQLHEILAEEELKQKQLIESQSIMELYIQSKSSFLSSDFNKRFIPTGFSNIDNIVDGFMPGEYVVVGARPGNSLNLFLLQLACNFSTKSPVLYISLNDMPATITARVLSLLSGIQTDQLLKQILNSIEKERLSKLELDLSALQLMVNTDSNSTITEFRLLCEKHVKENHTKVIFFDSIQSINPGFRSKNRREVEISYVNSELKRIARELDVCLIAGSHLSRTLEYRSGLEGKKPVLSDLRDSGSIEQEADKVFLLHRPDIYKITEDVMGNSLLGQLFVLLVKNEFGPLADFYLKYNENKTALVQMDYESSQLFNFDNDRLSEIKPPF